MRERQLTFDTVRQISRELPGVEESTAYGMPALKINGKLLATLPSHQSAEPDSLVVRVSQEDRNELLATEPGVYYVTEHYLGYDGVLVRLTCIPYETLKDLLSAACRYVTRKYAKAPSARTAAKPRPR